MQPALTRALQGIAGKRIAGVDVARLVRAAKEFIREQPRTFTEIRALVGELEPEEDVSALTYAVRTHVPLVQVPGGSPGASRAARCATRWRSPGSESRSRNGRTRAGGGALPRWIRAAASRHPGLVGARRAEARRGGAAAELRCRFADERGRELFDIPDAPLPVSTTSRPRHAFFLDYDNLILGHADRKPRDRRRCTARPSTSKAARVRATFLLDGFVSGTWRIERERGTPLMLVIEPFARLAREDRAALAGEAERLVAFTEPAAEAPCRAVRAGCAPIGLNCRMPGRRRSRVRGDRLASGHGPARRGLLRAEPRISRSSESSGSTPS